MIFKWLSRLLHIFVLLTPLYIFSYPFTPIMVEASPMTNIFVNGVNFLSKINSNSVRPELVEGSKGLGHTAKGK